MNITHWPTPTGGQILKLSYMLLSASVRTMWLTCWNVWHRNVSRRFESFKLHGAWWGSNNLRFICPAPSTDARMKWDLVILETKSTRQSHCCVFQTIPEFVFCFTVGHIILLLRPSKNIFSPPWIKVVCNSAWVGGTSWSKTWRTGPKVLRNKAFHCLHTPDFHCSVV